jgi:hypothetical protein
VPARLRRFRALRDLQGLGLDYYFVSEGVGWQRRAVRCVLPGLHRWRDPACRRLRSLGIYATVSLFRSEREQRALDFVKKHITRLRPGQRIDIAGSVLRDIPTMHHNGYAFTPPDRVLENIVGSSYEYRYHFNMKGDIVTFERLEAPLSGGRRAYVSPDRRDRYQYVGGLWSPLPETHSQGDAS